MTCKYFSINIPLSLFTLSDQFPPVQINWANVKEPGTEGMIYTRGKELDDLVPETAKGKPELVGGV